jgi:hypothetical protein
VTRQQDEQYLFETLLDHGTANGTPGAQPSTRAAELSEGEVAEIASQLVASRSEAEIDHLLPALLPRKKLAAAGLSRLATQPAARAAAQQVAKLIRSVTKAALPTMRRAFTCVPCAHAEGEQFLGDIAGSLFGGEVSEPHEVELEVAKRLVRFGNGALLRALLTALHQPPAAAARPAILSAAKAHAPGLLRPARRWTCCGDPVVSSRTMHAARGTSAGTHARAIHTVGTPPGRRLRQQIRRHPR